MKSNEYNILPIQDKEFGMELVLRRQAKRSCMRCGLCPENILMLACDDSICLQCAYMTLKDVALRRVDGDEIEFRCMRCDEVTYFDSGLIKQIESSVRREKVIGHSGGGQYQGMKNEGSGDDSFIEKMRRQYLNGDNVAYKQSVSRKGSVSSTGQGRSSLKQNNKLFARDQHGRPQDSRNFYHKDGDVSAFKSTFSKQKKIHVQESSNKCQVHSYYELLYYCLQCGQIVCSECLLRGKHKEHQNQSIAEILNDQLPKFINKRSEKLLADVHRLEANKDVKYSQLNQKINEIKMIRQNAARHFNEVKKNIEKQQNEVLSRCDSLLVGLKKQEKQIEYQQKEIEAQLSLQIREIKLLKSSYKQFLEVGHQKEGRKLQKLLIERFIACSRSMGRTVQERDLSSQFERKYSNQGVVDENESRMLNKKIEESIESIRQSLVFDPYRGLADDCGKGQKGGKVKSQDRVSIKEVQKRKACGKTQQNSYISYVSMQNSPNRSFQRHQKPSKASQQNGQDSYTSFSDYHQSRPGIPKGHLVKQAVNIEKENICLQSKQKQSQMTKLPSETSSNDVSVIKYKNSSMSKSRRTQMANKGRPKVKKNTVARFNY